jgi:hypothetical protein
MDAHEVNRVRAKLALYAADVFASVPRKDQRAKGDCYLRGLMLDGRRKSIQAMAARLPDGNEQNLSAVREPVHLGPGAGAAADLRAHAAADRPGGLALSKAGDGVGLAPKKPTSAFRPHLSLAYNNRRRSAAPVVEAVSRLRALSAVELPVSAVQLVELRREGRTYRRETRESVLLGY